MAPEREKEQMETETAQGAARGSSGPLGGPLFIAAIFAAGAGAALGTKALLGARQKGSSHDEDSDQNSDQDLPTVLRRAALDVAIAATNQAAERLDRNQSEARDEEPVEERS